MTTMDTFVFWRAWVKLASERPGRQIDTMTVSPARTGVLGVAYAHIMRIYNRSVEMRAPYNKSARFGEKHVRGRALDPLDGPIRRSP